jgi:diguanylate cyclase (GGDEF)-like protein
MRRPEEVLAVQVATLAQTKRRSPIGAVGWALLAWVALFAVATYLPGSESTSRRALLDIASIVMPAAAAALCWLASSSRYSPQRRDCWAWRFFALGFALSTLAEATWTFYELVLAQESPSPSLADVFFTAFYPAMFTGIFLLVRRPPGRFSRITIVLDSLLFTLGLAALAWQLVLAPSITGEDSLLLVAVTVSYPLWDLVLVFALTALFLSWRLERVAVAPLLLLASFAVTVLADLIYAWLMLQGEFSTGSIVDPLWPLSYALGGLAAISLIRGAAPASESRAVDTGAGVPSAAGLVDLRRSRVPRLLLPYLVFPAVVALPLLVFREHEGTLDTRDFLVLGFAVLLLALMIVRQFLTLLDNTSLGMLSQNLELQVVELTEKSDALTARSAQLDTLNRAATAFSRSLKPDEVLAAGLDLACEAAATTQGVVWVRERGAGVVLAAHRGLDETTRDILVVLQSEPSMGVVFKAQAPAMMMTADIPILAGLTDHLWHWDALAVVPLVSQGRALGVLGLLIDDASVNDRTDWQLLEESIGAQLGVALENAQQHEDALILAERDSVTGLLNHRGLHERLDQEVHRAQRVGGQVSLVMMDLDSFKLFNDTYGHPVGDDVLRQVSSHISAALRSSDIVGRYGGDEFAAILPDTDGQGAVELAHRLRAFIYDHPFESPDGLPIPLHLSCGVATYPADARSPAELVGFADANMYLSKQQGGNTVTSARAEDVSGITDKFAGAGAFGVLDGLLTAVDNKDRYTRQHSEDVTGRALMLGRHLALSDESQNILRVAGLLHDVGKIGVPDTILQKPGRLNAHEFDIVKHHVQLGELIIKEVPNLSEVIEAVGAHHEHFDGTGYPRGLSGEAIPRLGRILAVADAYSAMTTDRPYRKAMSHEEAKAEFLRVSGTQLDPALVQAFLTALEGNDTLAAASGQ